MSKKAFVVILILSVVVTYGAAFVDDIINSSKHTTGLPFGFASLNFLGGSTDGLMLILDITFWFVIIWIIWKAIARLFGRAGR